MKRVSSSTPLVSLSAVSLDLETTGVDVKEARIVQTGALHLDKYWHLNAIGISMVFIPITN